VFLPVADCSSIVFDVKWALCGQNGYHLLYDMLEIITRKVKDICSKLLSNMPAWSMASEYLLTTGKSSIMPIKVVATEVTMTVCGDLHRQSVIV